LKSELGPLLLGCAPTSDCLRKCRGSVGEDEAHSDIPTPDLLDSVATEAAAAIAHPGEERPADAQIAPAAGPPGLPSPELAAVAKVKREVEAPPVESAPAAMKDVGASAAPSPAAVSLSRRPHLRPRSFVLPKRWGPLRQRPRRRSACHRGSRAGRPFSSGPPAVSRYLRRRSSCRLSSRHGRPLLTQTPTSTLLGFSFRPRWQQVRERLRRATSPRAQRLAMRPAPPRTNASPSGSLA